MGCRGVLTPFHRLQIWWLLLSPGLFVLTIVLILAGFELQFVGPYQLPAVLLSCAATSSMALALGNAILRYRLFDNDPG